MAYALRKPSPYLLVFRESRKAPGRGLAASEMGQLVCRWVEWHETLRLAGVLQFCSAVDGPGLTLQAPQPGSADGTEPAEKNGVIGYMVIRADSLDVAGQLVRGCPPMGCVIAVDIYPAFEPLDG